MTSHGPDNNAAAGDTPGADTTTAAPDGRGEHREHTSGRPRRLYRHPTDRVIAGVAGGLGHYFDIDPVVFRILFVVLTFAGGTGLILYVAGWIVIRDVGEDGSLGGQVVGGAGSSGVRRWLGIGLLVLAGAIVLDDFFFVGDVSVWPLILVGLGIALLWQGQQPDRDAGRPRPTGAGADPGVGASPDREANADTAAGPGGSGVRTGADDVTAGPPSPSPSGPLARSAGTGPPPGPPRGPAETSSTPTSSQPSSILGRVTIGAILVVVGIAAFLDTTELVAIDAREYLALIVTLLGAGLLIGARWGRARWLMLPGLLLVPVLLVASLQPFTLQGGVGERTVRPTTVDELAADYELFAGELTIDLTQLDLGDQTVELAARVTMGRIEIVVPDDAAVDVQAEAGGGDLRLLGRRTEGVNVDLNVREPGDSGEIVLDLHAGLGEIDVHRAGDASTFQGPGSFEFGNQPTVRPDPAGQFVSDRTPSGWFRDTGVARVAGAPR